MSHPDDCCCTPRCATLDAACPHPETCDTNGCPAHKAQWSDPNYWKALALKHERRAATLATQRLQPALLS